MDTATGAGEVETPKNNKAWCKLHLEKVLQEREKWIKVDDFDVSPGCPPGENFVADVFRVVVYGSRLCLGTWTDFRTSIIIKRIPEERSFSHKFHDCSRLFQNEITAYEMILPMCLKYLKENSWEDVNNEFCFPRYYGQCQMFLVVQDLATEGYQVVNRVKGFSKKECSVILQELSRFHAVSFALKKREKQLFSDMKDRLIETVFREEYKEGLLGVIWENSLKFAVRSLNESNCPKLRKVSEKLQPYSGRVLTTLIDLSNSKCSKFNVICHGDLWNNNILLRYCDSGYPIGVKFIDLQAMRFSSCVLDVMHVIFTSSRPVVHERHLDVLLAEYFESLGSHLGNFGETLDFTFDEYKGEFESKVLFGVFVASLMFTCITRTSTATETADVVFDKEKLSSQTEVDKIYNSLNSAYHERLRSLFLSLTNLNLI